jgi:hypothetical protein
MPNLNTLIIMENGQNIEYKRKDAGYFSSPPLTRETVYIFKNNNMSNEITLGQLIDKGLSISNGSQFVTDDLIDAVVKTSGGKRKTKRRRKGRKTKRCSTRKRRR